MIYSTLLRAFCLERFFPAPARAALDARADRTSRFCQPVKRFPYAREERRAVAAACCTSRALSRPPDASFSACLFSFPRSHRPGPSSLSCTPRLLPNSFRSGEISTFDYSTNDSTKNCVAIRRVFFEISKKFLNIKSRKDRGDVKKRDSRRIRGEIRSTAPRNREQNQQTRGRSTRRARS